MTITVIAIIVCIIAFIIGGALGEYLVKKHFIKRIAELEHQVELKTESEKMWYNNYMKMQGAQTDKPEIWGEAITEPEPEPEQVYENEKKVWEATKQLWNLNGPFDEMERQHYIKTNNNMHHLRNHNDAFWEAENEMLKSEDRRTPGNHQP